MRGESCPRYSARRSPNSTPAIARDGKTIAAGEFQFVTLNTVGIGNYFGPNFVYTNNAGKMNNIIGNNGEVQFANGQISRDLRVSSGNLLERTVSSDPLEALSFGIAFVTTMLERRTQYHQSVLVSNLTSADESVRRFVTMSSHLLVTRGATTPDAIHQAYGLAESMMTQQAGMLAFMDCFHLLAIIVLAGLPLALLIKRFEIGKAAPAGH
jgi:hypothetical protein